MLDLNKLHIFSVVVQEGSFSAAASQLYMTQSAVSQHMKELEASLGRQLFQRGRRGVTLTQHGEVLNRYTREMFALVAKAESALIDVEKLTSGRINIGATPGIGVYLVPDWIQQFRTRYPHLTAALQTGVTSQITSDVLKHHLDLGFIEGELDEHPPARLASLSLGEIEQRVVVGPKHPYWKAERLKIEALRDQPLIVRQAGSQSRIWLERVLAAHGIEAEVGAEFDNLESIKRAVAMGACLAVLPPYVAQAEADQGTLHMIPLEGQPLTRSLRLVWDSHVHFAPITHAFLVELSLHFHILENLVRQATPQPQLSREQTE